GVTGTGAGGRITKADVQRVVEDRPRPEEKTETGKEKISETLTTPTIEKPSPVVQQLMQQEPGAGRTENRVKMSTLRKTIARRLVAAKNETAMLTTFNELDMSHILELRNKYKELFLKKYELKLGFMSFFVKTACIALKEFPEVNARLEEDEIIYHDYCDISIAVSTPKGLVVPVIFNADRLNLPQIEAKVDYLATRARDNKLTIEEMTGGTFSLTNGGVFGSLLSTPIINAPQTAILGMHKIEERPIAMNGEVVIRPMMYIALSYDHRIIDGKESVNFLVRVKELLEDPSRILLDV
ncbi:MAG: dihydrolipoyllysine-residue succinyltransferase, partial [Calditrichia bacterium]|nr:dihydrolipoyllysine-residue succinyltransferase [Calditrichia bacterium]